MERTGRAVSFASRVMVLLAAASLFFCGMLMLGAAEAKAYVSFDGVEVLYDGSPHAIAVSGVDESTEVYYSTTTSLNVYNYEQFGTTVKPSRTAAGSTLVYAFAKGKAGSTGSGSAYINIKPRVSAPDQTFYYDGNSHAATVKAEGGATVYYSTYRSLTYSNYKSYGSTSAPTFTNVDTYGDTVYYCAVPNTDASSSTTVSGSFLVKVLKNQVTIPSGGAKPYAGKAQDGIPSSTLYNRYGTYSATELGSYSARVTLKDTSHYEWSDGTTSTKYIDWSITKAPISNATASTIPAYTYSGTPCTPTPTLTLGYKTLTQGKDYTLSYSNNVNVGTASIIYTGMGTYFSGQKTVTFKIDKAFPQMYFEKNSKLAFIGGSTPKNPLTYLGDGVVTYSSSNTSIASVDPKTGALTLTWAPGTATITAAATAGSNYNAATVSYILSVGEPVSLMGGTAAPSVSTGFTYTGKTLRPSFVVKYDGTMLTEGEDYTVSYSATPKAIGSYKATVTGIEGFCDSLTVSFKIVPKAPKITSKQLDMTIGSKRQYTLKWSKVSGISGYQIKFSGSKTLSASAKTYSGKYILKKGKTYTVSIRAYKTVKGSKYYSPWGTYKFKA